MARWRNDLLLRGAGILLLAGAALCCRALVHAAAMRSPAYPALGEFALATGTFLGACGGGGLLVLGHHILDRVEVSSRWARLPRAPGKA